MQTAETVWLGPIVTQAGAPVTFAALNGVVSASLTSKLRSQLGTSMAGAIDDVQAAPSASANNSRGRRRREAEAYVETGLTARPGKAPGSVWVKMHILLLASAADTVRGIIASNVSALAVDVRLGGIGGAAVLSTALLSLREPGAESRGASSSGSGGIVGAAVGGVVAGLLALIVVVALISRSRSRRNKLGTAPPLGAFGDESAGNGGWQVENPAYNESRSVDGSLTANIGPDAEYASLSSTSPSSAATLRHSVVSASAAYSTLDHSEGASTYASLQAEGCNSKRPVSSVGSAYDHLGGEQSTAPPLQSNHYVTMSTRVTSPYEVPGSSSVNDDKARSGRSRAPLMTGNSARVASNA